jgi:hypothetical protein
MVDVQQGDGLILETPQGKIVFIDGGDNKLFARHAAWRYRHHQTSDTNPLEVDAILVTHGDADHFKGLNILRKTEHDRTPAEKRLFIHPKRIYHNGLVKASSTRFDDEEMFGDTAELADGTLVILDLYDDPRHAPADLQNADFKDWAETLTRWERHGPIDLRRIAFGDDEAELFDFLHEEGIDVELQGPFPFEVDVDGETRTVLPFLNTPKKSAEMHVADDTLDSDAPSASHTINGHSIAFRLTFGNVRFCLTGDLNRESMANMAEHLDLGDLEAEIVKAPHHGSHDFDFNALKETKPVVTIVSSGDESAFHEHIHPRATLMSALGKVNRGKTGILLCTELAAFFKKMDYSHTRKDIAKYFRDRKEETFTGAELARLFGGARPPTTEFGKKAFFGFDRTNFGIIHIRTDGERVLVFTHSGKKGLREAYRFHMDTDHKVKFAKEPEIRS